jgi:enoyl-[acyl-carrier protein] reductase II
MTGDQAHERPAPLPTRVTELLGIDYPILQAPMGFIARSQLASAVSNAGGLGIIETATGEVDAIRNEVERMSVLTDAPFAVNLPLLLLRDASFFDLLVGHKVQVVTTSAGDPTKWTGLLHEAGLTVIHVVGTLKAALKARDAGVDGLVVEGNEGGGFKDPRGATTMVLLPLVRAEVDLPIVAAGGVIDGVSMAAAFALGAEGVQMGTRMLCSLESPVHDLYKQLFLDATETDSLLLNRQGRPAYRVLRTPYSEQFEWAPTVEMGDRDALQDLYYRGNPDAALAFGGQAAGRIHDIKAVARIIADTIDEFRATINRLTDQARPPEQ